MEDTMPTSTQPLPQRRVPYLASGFLLLLLLATTACSAMANAMPAHILSSPGPTTDDVGPYRSGLPSAPPGATGPLEEARIRIEDGGFNPPRLTIPVGATVTWTNVGRAANTVTSATRVF